MRIIIVDDKITWAEVRQLAEESYGDMVKAVADINLELVAIGGEMHADAEQLLLANGSRQEDLWGFNIYPEAEGDKILEYVSFINIRPRQNNRSQEIASAEVKDKIKNLVKKIII